MSAQPMSEPMSQPTLAADARTRRRSGPPGVRGAPAARAGTLPAHGAGLPCRPGGPAGGPDRAAGPRSRPAAGLAGRGARRRSGAVHTCAQSRGGTHLHRLGVPARPAARRPRCPPDRPAAAVRPAHRPRPRAGGRGGRRGRGASRAGRPGGDARPAGRRTPLLHRYPGRGAVRTRPGRRRRGPPCPPGDRQGRPRADRRLRRPRRASSAGVAGIGSFRARCAPVHRPPCCSAPAAAVWTRGWPGPWCTGRWRRCRASRTSGRTAYAMPPRPTCSTGARTFVTYRSCSVTLSYRPPSSTRT